MGVLTEILHCTFVCSLTAHRTRNDPVVEWCAFYGLGSTGAGLSAYLLNTPSGFLGLACLTPRGHFRNPVLPQLQRLSDSNANFQI